LVEFGIAGILFGNRDKEKGIPYHMKVTSKFYIGYDIRTSIFYLSNYIFHICSHFCIYIDEINKKNPLLIAYLGMIYDKLEEQRNFSDILKDFPIGYWIQDRNHYFTGISGCKEFKHD